MDESRLFLLIAAGDDRRAPEPSGTAGPDGSTHRRAHTAPGRARDDVLHARAGSSMFERRNEFDTGEFAEVSC